MKKPVNIIHLVLNLDVGGLEWMVLNLLKGLDRKKFKPSVACLLNGGKLTKELKGIGSEVEILDKKDKLDFSASFKLARTLRERKIDVIHTHNTGAYIYGAIAAKLAGVPIIVHTEHGRNFPDKKRLMCAEKLLSTFTHKIVAVSDALRDALIRFEKINPNKISVIPNGISLDSFKPMHSEAIQKKRSEIGVKKDDYIIGCVGRLALVKDQANLIQAFSLVCDKIPQAKLVIVGDGPLKSSLKLKVENLALEEKVIFLGEREDIPELLNVFDLFVLPSKNEGISLTLLEAMATNKPVIATAVGGNKEIIDNGRDGCLVPANFPQGLAREILYLHDNPQKAKTMVSLAYAKVCNRYSSIKMAEEYQKIYEAALSRN